MKPIRIGLIALVALTLLAGCATIPATYKPTPAMSAEARRAHNRQVFDRAWQLMDKRFFDAKFRGVNWAAMAPKYRPDAESAVDDATLYGVINTMLSELKESHNVAIPPRKAYERKSKQGTRVGIALRRMDSHWVVTDVIPNSPAALAGVRRGWMILKRNGAPLYDRPDFHLDEGQSVTYEFLDEREQPQTVTMTARLISMENQRVVRVLEDGFVYLRFDGFDRASRRWFSDQLKAHHESPGVVIDLRQNHGGQAFSLLITLGEVFPKEVPMGVFVRRNGTVKKIDSLVWAPARYTGKIVALVDQASASCAEIFAHVLQFHQRATLVGRKTAGAVVVSRFFSMPDGGELQVGVQDYQGLDGKRLEYAGVNPDIAVPIRLDEIRRGYDADIAAALARLKEPQR